MTWLGELQWGTVSDWVSGIGTAFAVIVTLVFSLRSERQQAETHLAAVYAWFLVSRTGAAPVGELWLHNATEMPIYQWSVEVSWVPSPDNHVPVVAQTGSVIHGLLPPGKFPFALAGIEQLPHNDSLVQVDLRFT